MPLEQIIYEAREKGRVAPSLAASRRCSTIVDEAGCIITRGFVVPASRMSSTSSNRSSSISSQAILSTPATPIEDARPGYRRPTRSFFDAPELSKLREHLCRPSRSASTIEAGTTESKSPPADKRRTLQVLPSSRWDDNELADFTWKPSAANGPRPPQYIPTVSFPHCTVRPKRPTIGVRRTRSEQLQLKKVKGTPKLAELGQESQSRLQKDVEIVAETQAESAIASDSEEGEDEIKPIRGAITASRSRSTYALRRSRGDQIAAAHRQLEQREAAPLPALVIRFQLTNRNESAIEEDEDTYEDGLPERVTAALNLAQIHRTRNSVTADVQEGGEQREGSTSNSAPKAKILLKILADQGKGTPTDLGPANIPLPLVPRTLQPSRSQPRPTKGVLKKSGSQSEQPSSNDLSNSTTRVLAKQRRNSLQIGHGRAEVSEPVLQKISPKAGWNDISVRFAPAA